MKYISFKYLFATILFLCGIAASAESASLPIYYTTTDGLPGTTSGSNYVWDSGTLHFDSAKQGIRITVFDNNGDNGGRATYEDYPMVAIGELEFYDGNGNKIAYTAPNVTTNSLESTEGSLANLCDGDYSTFYHSTWSSGTIPDDYVYVDVKFPQAVTAVGVKIVSRDTKRLTPTFIGVTESGVKCNIPASCGENAYWSYSNGTLTISGSGEMNYCTSLYIPWEEYKSEIKSVVIENGITTIGDYAFKYCSGLTSVTIPNSVTSIGGYAFDGCTGLTSITIPNSVTTIGGCAFDGCTGLTSITIPNSVTTIGSSAFCGCTGLTSIEISNSVTSIGIQAFYNCSALTSITIPNSVTTIGSSAFYGCSGLTSIVVDSGNSIYDSSEGCNAIIETATNTLIAGCKNTIIPNSVTTIGDYAFYNCRGLTSIEIPNSVTTIGGCAFYNCTGLTSVTIPNSVTSIGDYAFYGCRGLTSVTIGNSVTTIGREAFYYCNNLKTVYNNSSLNIVAGSTDNAYVAYYADKVIAADGSFFEIVNGFQFQVLNGLNTLYGYVGNSSKITLPADYNGENYIIGSRAFYRCSDLTSVTISNGVTSIGEDAFFGCSGLTSITIPNSVTSIGDYAFYDCTGLTSIEIPNSVTTIGRGAFYGCSGLTSITIPNSVTTIGSSAFIDCSSLTSIDIPNSVTSIKWKVFSGCSSLTSVKIGNGVISIDSRAFEDCSTISEIYVKATPPPAIYDDTFSPTTATLYVPTGTKALYQEANNWKEFTNIVEMDFPSIGDVDNDEVVDVADVTTLVSIILGVETGTAAADVDSDGAVDVADVTTLVSIILGTYEPPLPPSLSFSQAEFAVNVGDILDLTSYLEITSISLNDLTWSTSNPKVLTVAGGAVTALQCGEATVTVRYNSEFIAECRINVIDAPDAGGSEGTGEEEW